MKFYLKVLNNNIPVEVFFRNRRTMELQIDDEGDIRVLAPIFTSKQQIINSLEKKIDWIVKKRRLVLGRKIILDLSNKPERISILGSNYQINILHSHDNKITIRENIVEVYAKDIDQSTIELMLKQWLREIAYDIVKERLDYFSKLMDLEYHRLIIKDQKTRWGSCSNLGNININFRIITFPMEVIDYLVVHELSHIKHMDHSKEFWENVKTYIPDYKHRRKLLREREKIV